MPATPAWLASVEALLNRSIAGSSKAAAAARRLNRTAVEVDVEGITRLRITVAGERLVIAAAGDSDTPADAGISASALALVGLLGRGGDLRVGAGQDSARIRGDADIANRYRELMVLARPDLEEELSRWIGDGPARRVSQAAKAALSWTRKARRTAGQNIAEYLTEESRDLVSRSELEEFLSAVDQLRESTDRIEAKLGRLERRLKDEA